jgi:hypothetical protein
LTQKRNYKSFEKDVFWLYVIQPTIAYDGPQLVDSNIYLTFNSTIFFDYDGRQRDIHHAPDRVWAQREGS